MWFLAARGRGTSRVSHHIGRGPGHMTIPEANGFDCTRIWRKRAHVFYSKSMYWHIPLGLSEQNFAIGRAACRGSLLDSGVFPDLEGAFPDPEKYFQNLKISQSS